MGDNGASAEGTLQGTTNVPPNTALTERPEQIPAWDSLSADQKSLFAHMMEVYAAALSYADHQIGRLLDAIEESGQTGQHCLVWSSVSNGSFDRCPMLPLSLASRQRRL